MIVKSQICNKLVSWIFQQSIIYIALFFLNRALSLRKLYHAPFYYSLLNACHGEIAHQLFHKEHTFSLNESNLIKLIRED